MWWWWVVVASVTARPFTVPPTDPPSSTTTEPEATTTTSTPPSIYDPALHSPSAYHSGLFLLAVLAVAALWGMLGRQWSSGKLGD